MPLKISRNDITEVFADAIVNPTDVFLSGSGSIDRRIHELCGEGLKKELSGKGLAEGEALISESHDFGNCRYIIHVCGPVWKDDSHGEEEKLSSCYEEALRIAEEYKLSSIVFPQIASGSFGFPKGKALKIANDVITSFLLDHELDVELLVYDRESFDLAGKLYADIRDYLKRNLEKDSMSHAYPVQAKKEKRKASEREEARMEEVADYAIKPSFGGMETYGGGLENLVFEPDESFSECLVRMIDERKMKDPDVYKRANIDRKHFNHIINTKDYRPKKETVVALAIGLRLTLKETDTLLERAGFVLSRSSKFDLIIRYCISHRIYDIFKINEILFAEDQKLLGV